jgi:hypothetical protein
VKQANNGYNLTTKIRELDNNCCHENSDKMLPRMSVTMCDELPDPITSHTLPTFLGLTFHIGLTSDQQQWWGALCLKGSKLRQGDGQQMRDIKRLLTSIYVSKKNPRERKNAVFVSLQTSTM